MAFSFNRTAISEVVVIDPQVFSDQRGFFIETYKLSEFVAQGISETFVQGNHSKSLKGTLRGLHYQKHPKAQGKLVRAIAGDIYDVVADIRLGSPTHGEWVAVSLSSANRRMLYIPPGFAHGFCVVSDEAEIVYMTTAEYAPATEAGVIWNDPDLRIEWPIAEPQLSDRDRRWPRLKNADNNFRYHSES
jgi:dTDP-4-dehydrorhamnose 3,5-epimerase